MCHVGECCVPVVVDLDVVCGCMVSVYICVWMGTENTHANLQTITTVLVATALNKKQRHITLRQHSPPAQSRELPSCQRQRQVSWGLLVHPKWRPYLMERETEKSMPVRWWSRDVIDRKRMRAFYLD